MRYDLTHVRHDPAHASCPGLFRSFLRGKGKQALHLTYAHGDRSIEIQAPFLLGAVDLWVLQGLIAMAVVNGKQLSLQNAVTEEGRQLAKNMNAIGVGPKDIAMAVAGGFSELAREMGYAEPDSHSTRRILQKSMERLFTVTMFVGEGDERQGYHLLSSYASKLNGNTFNIGLNPMIATAVVGDARYISIPMGEIRAIRGDATRLIHQRLCAFINEGATHPTPIRDTTLYEYIWHELEASPQPGMVNKIVKRAVRKLRGAEDDELDRKERERVANLERYRRKKLKDAIDELTSLGWVFDPRGKSFMVSRPEASK